MPILSLMASKMLWNTNAQMYNVVVRTVLTVF